MAKSTRAKKSAAPKTTATKTRTANGEKNPGLVDDLSKGDTFYFTNSPGEKPSKVVEVNDGGIVYTTEGKEGNALKSNGTQIYK